MMLESLRVMAELVIGAKINSNESYPKLPPALNDQFSPQMTQFPSGYRKEKEWKIPALSNATKAQASALIERLLRFNKLDIREEEEVSFGSW